MSLVREREGDRVHSRMGAILGTQTFLDHNTEKAEGAATDVERRWTVWKFSSELHYFSQKQGSQLIFEDGRGGGVGGSRRGKV